MTTTRNVTTTARRMIVYTQPWVDEEPIKSGKKKGEFREGSFTIRLRADFKGIVPWITRDPGTGRVPELTEDNYDEFLIKCCHEDDLETLANEQEAGHFGDAARYDAARTAHRNASGETDWLTAAARVHNLNQQAEKLEQLLEKTAGALRKEAGIEDEKEEVDDAAPLDD